MLLIQKQNMKAQLIIAMLLICPSPHLQGKEQPVSGYSTLVIEYMGDMDRPVFPIIISSSKKEGEWYRQHLFTEGIRIFTLINVVQTSTMAEIASIGPLRNSLERPTPPPDHLKAPTVRFVAGARHRYAETTLDAKTAMTVLKAIEDHLANYPDVRNDVLEIDLIIRRTDYDSTSCNQISLQNPCAKAL